MIKRVVQIIVLLLPFLAFLIFSSCADPQPIDDEFKVTKDMNLIEETLFEKNYILLSIEELQINNLAHQNPNLMSQGSLSIIFQKLTKKKIAMRFFMK